MLESLLVVLALPALFLAEEPKPAPEGATAPAKVEALAKAEAAMKAEVQVGTGVERKDLTGAAEEFKVAPDTKLYVWAKVSGVAAGGKVTLAFFKGDTEAYKRELSVSGSPYRLNVYKTFRAADGGDWTAKVLGEDGSEIATAKFKVEIEE
jgi:hypothetical protein